MKKTIYLDHAAATPLDHRVLVAMEPYFTDIFYNPSASYLAGRRSRQALQDARADVAKVLGAKPAEIFFTAGATEANNLAVQGVTKAFSGGEVVTSAIEHDSVYQPAAVAKHKIIEVDKDGLIEIEKAKQAIGDDTVLLSVILVSNELGTVQSVGRLADLVKEIRHERAQQRAQQGVNRPLYLHTDASAAANHLGLEVSRLGVDMMSLNGGKIYGPKQSGILFVRSGVNIEPLILGGGQERGLRSGTENVAGSVGFATALKLAQADRRIESEKAKHLKHFFATQLQKANINFLVNGSLEHGAPHILSLRLPGVDNERLMMELDEDGIICAVGSACSASKEEPSRILKAIGLTDDLARSTLRFSFGRTTTEKSLSYTAKKIAERTSSAR